MPSAKWIKPSRLHEIDDLISAAVYEQRTRRMAEPPVDPPVFLVDMPVAMELRAVFIQQNVEGFETPVRQVFHVAVAAAWRMRKKDIEYRIDHECVSVP